MFVKNTNTRLAMKKKEIIEIINVTWAACYKGQRTN